MAEAIEKYLQCRQHIMQKVARNTSISIQIISLSEATAHSLSANYKLPDLTPARTITIPLSASVVKSLLWRTEFVTIQTQA